MKCFHYAVLTERKRGPIHCFGATIAYKSKARCMSFFVQHLAGDNLKVPLRSRPTPDVSTVQADNSLYMDCESRDQPELPSTFEAAFPSLSSGSAQC